ncbi:sushi, nidogen and EGF-like domain-containing protein 1 [Onychostoma macrolepis]|uniref:sushi, nidogen and EGF-like domain-containing protein 1 n=1 Tax=Onychostoma macrolepis TaxID=369639 RepID=UPI00272A4642|nr:sushi, nidogen and EGF-like domain-containing protein 1 [Onychostoma macrolepis]
MVFAFILAETTTLATTTVTPETTTTTTPEPTTTAATETTTSTTTVSTTTATTTPWTAPDIFYPFGAAAGDTQHLEINYDSSYLVTFSTPFVYFGRTYNAIYVNNNGLITFNQTLPEAHPPYPFPTYGNEDYIAPLWTDLDDLGIGIYSYQEYTTGSVLTRATQDINQYFPGRGFSASWVFVVTWDYVLTWDMNVFNSHSGPAITFQAVLISGDGFSFILMHYGDCAGEQYAAQAGYDTIGSTDYYQIHHNPNDGYSIPILKTTTNVDIPGRWAFLVNNGSAIIGVQMKLESFLDLTQSGNIKVVLHQIEEELVSRGLLSSFKMKLRKVKKTQP